MPQNDYGVGTGTQTTYPLTEKTALEIGNIVQFGSVQKIRHTGGFDVSGSNIILNEAPALDTVIIFPAKIRLTIQAYDQSDVPGEVTPREKIEPFIIADASDISGFSYYAATSDPSGIKVFIVDHDEDVGAAVDWFSLAKSDTDQTPGTFGTPGDPVYFDDIVGFTALNGATLALATTLVVDDGSQIPEGSWITIDSGVSGKEEIVWCSNVTGNTLTVTNTTYAHNDNATVHHSGWMGFLHVEVPEDAAGGQPGSTLDDSIDLLFNTTTKS